MASPAYLPEGKEHERALGNPGWGRVRRGIGEFRFTEKEDIDIDDAWSVSDWIDLASDRYFEGLGLVEEPQWIVSAVVQIDYGVQETRRIRGQFWGAVSWRDAVRKGSPGVARSRSPAVAAAMFAWRSPRLEPRAMATLGKTLNSEF